MSGKRLNIHANIQSPCKDCPERFTACSDHCPKDERGEYGYKAWKEELESLKVKKNEYFRDIRRKKWRKYGSRYDPM